MPTPPLAQVTATNIRGAEHLAHARVWRGPHALWLRGRVRLGRGFPRDAPLSRSSPDRGTTTDRWLRAVLKRRAPSMLALWSLFTDDVKPCTWRDVNDGASNQAQVRGGDHVVVSFVSP